MLEFNRIESHDPVTTANYRKLNQKIEQASELYYFVLVTFATLGCIIPALLLTAINYAVFDLTDESYFLPLPILCVLPM